MAMLLHRKRSKLADQSVHMFQIALQVPDAEDADAANESFARKRLRNGRSAASRERAASLAGRAGAYAEFSDDDGEPYAEVGPLQSCYIAPLRQAVQ